MDKDLMSKVKSILISGTKEDLDAVLSELPEDKQKQLLIDVLTSSVSILEDSKLNHVKTRPLLYHLIKHAEKRGIEEGKEVFVTYVDQRKLGKINKEYGPQTGDKAIEALIDSLHSGFEGVKKSNYDIIRMGGDEFCIVTVGESIEALTEDLKEAKTTANTIQIYSDGKPINYKVDFAFGSSKLDLSNGRTLRQVIDSAKDENYFSQKLVEAEEIAEASKLVVVDTDKEIEKQKAIGLYIKNITRMKKAEKDFSYEIIGKKENDDVQSQRKDKKEIDMDFIIELSKISEATGLKKEVLIDQLNKHDLEFLKENYIAYGENFIREGRDHFIKRSSLDLLSGLTSIGPTTKVSYVEVDNLKLVNSARTHKDGDKYIADFMQMLSESIDECDDKTKESYVVKMSGNSLVLVYDEANSKIIDTLVEKASKYDDPNINIPMNIYACDMNPANLSPENIETEFISAGDDVKAAKEEFDSEVQKIISAKDGYEIFYQREIFTIDDVIKNAEGKLDNDSLLIDELKKLVAENKYESLRLIDELELSDEEKEFAEEYISTLLMKEEIEVALDANNESKKENSIQDEDDTQDEI